MIKDLVIGSVSLDGNLILAPMAGVTDLPYRVLCKEQGASLVYTEMISAKGIYYNNKNTEKLWEIDETERPAALQLFGSDPGLMADMAKKIDGRNFDILDINMGCPVPKVVNNGEGSALMKTPELAGRIIRAVSDATDKPLTVKFRKGFGKDDNTAVEFAKMAEANGAAAVAVHGRTREQYYTGKADWDVLADVKKAVSIPVIGNGDVIDEESAKAMFEQTGVDGIMIGRGSMGNPWIFEQIRYYLETGNKLPRPTNQEKYEILKEHIDLDVLYKGEFVAMNEMRKHIGWYTKNMPDASSFRNEINHITTRDELLQKIKEYFR